MFDFSASLNDIAPLSPISLSDYVMRKEKSELLMDVFFLLSSPVRLSSVSVVFDFNASPNDVTRKYPMLYPVG